MTDRIRQEWPSLAFVLTSWAIAAATWSSLPESVPAHWNAYGEVDRMGGRAEAALLMPALVTVMAFVLAAVPAFDRRGNFKNFRGAYDGIRYGVLGLELFVQGVVVGSALGLVTDGGRLVIVGVGVLFAWLGNLLGKLRPNGFAGIRTPWTLTSVRSWNTTHRIGGWMFVATGLATVAAALVSMPAAVATLLGGALATVIVSTWVSWRVWRDDPDRSGFGGVRPAE